MTTQSTLTLFMWLYPIFLLGVVARIVLSAKERPRYSTLFAGLLVSFLGLIRFRVFHDPHGSFLLNVASFPLLLLFGIWGITLAFSQQKQRRT